MRPVFPTRRFSTETYMLGIGQKFPQYALTGVVSNDLQHAFQPFTNDSFAGKWQVIFFWPKDFTFVCPTEIAAFGKLDKEFKARDAQLISVTTNSDYDHPDTHHLK